MPEYLPAAQPIRAAMAPDLTDSSLVASFLIPGKTAGGADYSSASNDMTPFGTTYWGEYGAIFDGNSDYLRKAVANFRSSDSAGTIELWFKYNAVATYKYLFASADEGDLTSYLVVGTGSVSKLSVLQQNGDTQDDISGGTTLVAGQWYHAVVVSSGTAYAIYLNGVAETLTVNSGANNGDWFADSANRDNVTVGVLVRSVVGGSADAEIACVNVHSEAKTAAWAASRHSAAVPDSELALWVPFGDRDYSRYDRALTVSPGALIGQTITLDGVAYIRTAAIDGIADGATVSMWFKPRVDGDYVLLNNVPHINRRTVIKLYAGGDIRAGYWNGAVYKSASGSGVLIGAWNHVVAAYDGADTMTLVLNGTQLTGSDDPSSGSNVFLDIGRSTGGSDPFDGQLRDVRYYVGSKSLAWAQMCYANTAMYH